MSKRFFTALFASTFLLTVFSFTPVSVQAQYYSAYQGAYATQMESNYAPYASQGGYDYGNYGGYGDYGDYADCYAAPTYGNHVFYGRLESVFWNLEGGSKRSLIMQNINGENYSRFSCDDIDYDVNGSPRVVLGLNITPYTSIEGVYTGFHHLRNNYFFEGNDNLLLPGAMATIEGSYFFNAEHMGIFSETDFHSAEFNVVRRTRVPYISWLVGFRYVNFEEKFDITSMVRGATRLSSYQTRSSNDLYGGQLGVKSELPLTERLGLQFLGKAGVYSNRARQSNWVNEIGTEFQRNTKGRSSKTSFLGEINVGGYVKITENVLFVGGYNLMWIGDLARAADQIDFTYTTESGKSLKTDSAFLHGANVGIEMRF